MEKRFEGAQEQLKNNFKKGDLIICASDLTKTLWRVVDINTDASSENFGDIEAVVKGGTEYPNEHYPKTLTITKEARAQWAQVSEDYDPEK